MTAIDPLQPFVSAAWAVALQRQESFDAGERTYCANKPMLGLATCDGLSDSYVRYS